MPSRKTAIKKDPVLWEHSKKMACKSGRLCKHSARKMQWAVNYYKKHGGTYVGSKSKANSMAKWTRQRWTTATGQTSGGRRRYLPHEAWKHLSASEIRRTNRAKSKGFSKGQQWVRQPKDIARKTAPYRRIAS